MFKSNQQTRLCIGNITFVFLLVFCLLLGPTSNPVAAQPERCAAGATEFVLSPTNPVPGSNMQLGLQSVNPTYATNFNNTTLNQFVAHTFDLSSFAPNITQAWLETSLMPLQGQPDNDAIVLAFFDAAGNQNPQRWARRIGTDSNAVGLLPNIWDAINYPSGSTFDVALDNLPEPSGTTMDLIPSLNSQASLDLYIQDDTTVHSLALTICVQQNPCPVDVMLVLDKSESMNLDGPPSRMDVSKSAAIPLIRRLNPATDRAGLVSFNGVADFHSPPGFTNNFTGLENAINALTVPPGGGTNLGEGINEARRVLDANQRPGIPQVMILLTDGEFNGPRERVTNAADLAKQTIRIIAIGLGSTVNEQLLKNEVASKPSDYFPATTLGLPGIFSKIVLSLCLQPNSICDNTPGHLVRSITTSGVTTWQQPNRALIDEQAGPRPSTPWTPWTPWAPGYPNRHSAVLNLVHTYKIHDIRAYATGLHPSSGTIDVEVNGSSYPLVLGTTKAWFSIGSPTQPFPSAVLAHSIRLTRYVNTANIDEIGICASID